MRTLRHFVYLLIIAASLTSCSKSFSLKQKKDQTVCIRVDNKTSFTATAMRVNGEDYGTIAAGENSSYHSFSNLAHIPAVKFYNDTTEVVLVTFFCGTGMTEPSYLESGDYVYTITENPSNYYGCDYSFVKE